VPNFKFKEVTSNVYKLMLLNETSPFILNYDSFICKICSKEVIKTFMRQHIGKHILRDETLKNENLCGFCGLVTGCNIELRTTSGSGIYKTLGPYSKCQFFCSFSLKAESKSSTQTPCTNRPVICSQCK